MSNRSTKLLKAALSAMHYSGADRLLAPLTRGQGVIFMLHSVTPEPPQPFEPNRILKVTPDFLDAVICDVKAAGFEPVSLDEAAVRLVEGASSKPFACFTLDDGYRDNLRHAYPVFKRHAVPFTVFVPSDFAGGTGDVWWLSLEESLRRTNELVLEMRGERHSFALSTTAEKTAVFNAIYCWLRRIPESDARAVVADIARQCGHDTSGLCRKLFMSWDEVRRLAADPLVTIGAHTLTHRALAKLDEREARREIAESVRRIEEETGTPCRHFSFPYGDAASAGEREFRLARELGLTTAVTTEKGVVSAAHAAALTALPRLSLNGDFQDRRHVKVLMSGVPFALLNAAKRLAGRNAA